MAKITFLGGEETGNVDHVMWGRFRFEVNKAVECDDPHIIKKARKNRFYRVDGDDLKPDPMAKARAARAAKRAAAEDAKADAA